MSLPTTNDPIRDEIIAEVRAIRASLAAEFDHDVSRLFAEMKRREAASDRGKLAASPKRLAPVATPED